jgi:salicylate hydroxylase
VSGETVVAGGGIGGLTAALALAASGRPVRVLEQASHFQEIGAGIQLAPNAILVLEQLGVFDRLEETAVRPKRLVLMNATNGKEIVALDLGERFQQRYRSSYVVLHRADLLNALVAACHDEDLISLETDRRVVAVEDTGSLVRVECADGAAFEGDGLVGADGIKSMVRKLIADDEPITSPHVAYRGAFPLAGAEIDAPDDVLMWVGPGVHFVQYRLRGGTYLNQVAVFVTGGTAFEPGSPDELEARFAFACDRVQSALAHIDRTRNWSMQEQPALERWTNGRVTLLGDAAHAMLQYIAQGACQAIEDAAVLGLRAQSADDVAEAFAQYDTERAPRTADVQRAARQWGELCHLDGVGSLLRDQLFGTRSPYDYGSIDWLYGYSLRETVVASVPSCGH